jgi:transposase
MRSGITRHHRPAHTGAFAQEIPTSAEGPWSQSGETDVTGRISKIGDHGVRMALYEAANVMLTRPVKGSALKSWDACGGQARRDAQGQGGARKLAVFLHRMMRSGEQFLRAGRAATVAC